MSMPRGIPKSKPIPKVKDPKTVNLKRVVKWTGGSTIEDTCSVFLSKSALFTLDREIKRLKGFEMVSDWTLYNADTNEVLASKYSETPKQKALRLYKELGNYAEVARQMELHPTTIRTWCKEKTK